jgi:TRAP-type mannitol/chloroaromatic compound transport system substrate-binding protein
VAAAAPSLAAPAIAQSAPEIKWRMASSFSKSLDLFYGAGLMICRYVAECTDNKFQISAHPAGELTPSRQALDAVTSGAIECAHTPLFFYAGKDPTLGLGSGLPFGLNPRHQLAWWSFAGGGEIVNVALKKLNVLGMPAGCTGAQMGAWFKKEIFALEDLKGLRFRVAALGGPILTRIGVMPLSLRYNDMYAALENDTIDAAEFISPYDDEKLGLVKVAKYNYYPCWWESAGMVHFVASLDTWNALPKNYRAIVARGCDAANAWMLARYDTVNPPALKRLVGAGAVLKPFPPAVLEACYKATIAHFAELAAKDPHFKRGLDSASAFRRDEAPWWQVAEHAFDGLLSLRDP